MKIPNFFFWRSKTEKQQEGNPTFDFGGRHEQPSQKLLTFRAAEIGDAEKMAVLYDEECKNGHFLPVGVETTFYFRQIISSGRVRIASLAGNYDSPVTLDVALLGSELIGFSIIKAWIDPEELLKNTGRGKNSSNVNEAELWKLIVDPSKRNQGIGTALLERQIDKAIKLVGTSGGLVARCLPASTEAKRLLLRKNFTLSVAKEQGELLRRPASDGS